MKKLSKGKMEKTLSPCIVCGILLEYTWEGKPSMWCEECSELKTDCSLLAAHIYRALELGNLETAVRFKNAGLEVISVHENPDYVVGIHRPFMDRKPKSDWDRSGGLVNIPKLHEIADEIEKRLDGPPFLIHCKGGIERSPLAVAFFLHHKLGFTYHEAYNFIIRRRPIVSSRIEWFPEDYKKEHLTY